MLDKTYRPELVETKHYEKWERDGAFECGKNTDEDPYAIVIPPPNVTGSLHMGHALNNTLQDLLIRCMRMRGRDTLWQPGMDHAGIATQMVVERQLEANGQTRADLGRDAFLKKVWEWKAESGGDHYWTAQETWRFVRLESGTIHDGRGPKQGCSQGICSVVQRETRL